MDDKTRDKHPQAIGVDQPGVYRIMIQGRLREGMTRRFAGFDVRAEQNPAGHVTTTLIGRIEDQAALHGIVSRVRDLGLPLVLVELLYPVAVPADQGETTND
jgi:hypothetical protein